MILLLHVIDERCGIDLPAGTIVIPIEDHLDRIVLLNDSLTRSSTNVLMTSDGKIIRDVSLVEITTDNPSWNVSDPTKKLKISRDGSKAWYKNGQLHRNDGPAVEWSDGTKWWYKNGQYHCDAQPGQSPGPAIEWADGTKMWYKNGQRHRDAQPGQSPGPAVEWSSGTKWWYKNGQRHRDDGPAIERADGTKEWYKNGQRCGEPR